MTDKEQVLTNPSGLGVYHIIGHDGGPKCGAKSKNGWERVDASPSCYRCMPRVTGYWR